jgi:uncharacterized oxidoreductase
MALQHRLSGLDIQVFEVVPPAVDTELNAEGRAQRGRHERDLKLEKFTVAVMKGLEEDLFEIGYGMSARILTASRADLGRRFQQMNSRW